MQKYECGRKHVHARLYRATQATREYTHTHSRPLLLIFMACFRPQRVLLKESWPLCWRDYALSLRSTTPDGTSGWNSIVQKLLLVRHCTLKCANAKQENPGLYCISPIPYYIKGWCMSMFETTHCDHSYSQVQCKRSIVSVHLHLACISRLSKGNVSSEEQHQS